MFRFPFPSTALVAGLIATAPAHAAEVATAAAAQAMTAEQTAKLMAIPKGFDIRVWAKEPHLANPVGFAIDDKGRIYVAETFRHKAGALDNRARLEWLSDAFKKRATPERMAGMRDELLDREIGARTLEDRAAVLREYVDPATMTVAADRVSLVEDTNGDGVADRGRVFAGGFNEPLDGIGAAVLPWRNEVFYTNLPHLWSLRDRNGDGVADERKSLASGFGVRYAFIGHDLHGLRMGPDGRLYFSIGDRGAHVRTMDGRTIAVPDTGAVFRCNPDGTELEAYATGLRNPQDLVFDKRGDLFTGDNNSDGGDQARWVHVVEGGDSGWRIGYQFITGPVQRGPWNAEKMWHKAWPGQPAHIVPPVEIIANGPSGVAVHPGTGWSSARWADRFFLVDFKGQPSLSGVWSFGLRDKGASHEMVGREKAIWGVLTTDADFGPDGALYVLDWVTGWDKTNLGRIYRVADPAAERDPLVAETKRLLAEGFARQPDAELAARLGHADQRVRQGAQFALVDRKAKGALIEVLGRKSGGLARLHALWGIGQLLRQAPDAGLAAAATAALADEDAEVRGQAAKVLGDARVVAAFTEVRARTADPSARVRMFAATALGHLGRPEGIAALAGLLRANADADPFLRNAAVVSLSRLASGEGLRALAADPSRAVRLGALLALRRQHSPEVAAFLADADPGIVREAAAAINDEGIAQATEALARWEAPKAMKVETPVALRVLNASFRLGTAEGASRLAAFAARSDRPTDARREAILALGDWPSPSNRDRVTGLWRPYLTKRDPKVAAAALQPVFASLLKSAPAPVVETAVATARRVGLASAAPDIAKLVAGRRHTPLARAEGLKTLAALKAPELAATVAIAAKDPAPEVRVEALRLRVAASPATARPWVAAAIVRGSRLERQAALDATRALPPAEGDALLTSLMDRLVAGKLPPELALDVLELATARGTPGLKAQVAAYDAARPKDDLGPFREVLAGGDVAAGRAVFKNKAEVSCLRCHKAGEPVGGEAGPDLAGIARRRKPQALLESIVVPNASFAPGFESVVLTMKNDAVVGGTLKKETPSELVVLTGEQETVTLKKADVKKRDRGISGMPDGLGYILTKRELRDLVAFLGSLE